MTAGAGEEVVTCEVVVPAGPDEVFRWFDLREHPEGTHVRLVHRDLAPEMRQLHAEGWARFLPRLAAVVVGASPGPDPAQAEEAPWPSTPPR